MATIASNPAIGVPPLQEKNNPFTAEAPMDSLGAGGRDVPEGQEDYYQERLQRARQGGTPIPETRPRAAKGDREGAPVGGKSLEQAENMESKEQEGRMARVLRRLAERRGLTKGQSATEAGAAAAEGIKSAAQSAASQYILKVAFGLLPTLMGSVPALLYLNFHYIMSKRGSERFQPMLFWQKIVLLFADILALVILFIVTVLIVSIYQLIDNPSGALEFIS